MSACSDTRLICTAAYLALVILSVAMILAVVRLLRGPSTPDRVVALDLFAMLAVGVIAVLEVMTDEASLLFGALIWGLVSFLGTVAFARYLTSFGKCSAWKKTSALRRRRTPDLDTTSRNELRGSRGMESLWIGLHRGAQRRGATTSQYARRGNSIYAPSLLHMSSRRWKLPGSLSSARPVVRASTFGYASSPERQAANLESFGVTHPRFVPVAAREVA
jgi:multicomponent Na+:H+ antiporter subunit F